MHNRAAEFVAIGRFQNQSPPELGEPVNGGRILAAIADLSDSINARFDNINIDAGLNNIKLRFYNGEETITQLLAQIKTSLRRSSIIRQNQAIGEIGESSRLDVPSDLHPPQFLADRLPQHRRTLRTIGKVNALTKAQLDIWFEYYGIQVEPLQSTTAKKRKTLLTFLGGGKIMSHSLSSR